MSRLQLCLLLLWLGISPAVAAEPSPPATSPPPAPPVHAPEALALGAAEADRELLATLYRKSAATPSPAGPTFSAYLAEMAGRVAELLRDWIGAVLPGVAALLEWLEALGWRWVLLVLLLLFLGLLIWRLARRPPAPGPAERRDLRPLPPPVQEEAPAEAWERLLEQRLRAGEVAAALEALWWWLAGRLVPGEARHSWTSRELVLAGRRRDLLPEVRVLDRMLYGAAEPAADEVRRLYSRLVEAVP